MAEIDVRARQVRRVLGVKDASRGPSFYDRTLGRPLVVDVDMCVNRHVGYDSPKTLIARGLVVVVPMWEDADG